MRIAVTTPTGHVGRHLVPILVRAGVRPLVLARRPEKLPARLRAEVDTVAVDQFDSDAVVEATAGVDTIYWVDPPASGDDPLAEYRRAATSIARAVTKNGIGRVVFQSSVGAEKRRGAGEIDGLAATELALDDTDADVTHLRCGYFFSNLEYQLDMIASGTVQVIVPVDHPMPWVAPRDIAEVAATRLLSTEWSGRHVQAVHGPSDLTWTQVAEIVSAATDLPLRAEQIADDEMRRGLQAAGLSDAQVDAMTGMSTGLRDGFVPEQSRSIRSTTPTTLAAWAYDVLRPQL
ncbi:NAD(P)H-binding protein [Rhodococcus sp. BL-253-APC-6A1W]|uniref:NAD(P)H-binding protein n=1 Tax=Rhodococcus sp. BL-253-APC-6A1W TaxID=2725307 RepID=UPI00146A5F59|nr:NAD(P)H-binding protein [Rhodococcus sp. BL-253-APC-6A1W]NMD95789.1 NAD(P)H-binding protein [Rhodococcus sp. BL-253-APC-6A1W]